jgi:DNA invertase Pin-like site-specific DNA recombinase
MSAGRFFYQPSGWKKIELTFHRLPIFYLSDGKHKHHLPESGQMKAIGYIRVSTAQQADEGISLDAQTARIQAYAAANGLELAAVYSDAGLSGKRADNRPGLVSALDAVCECQGVLVVYSLSRLARSVADTIAISQRLQKSGAELASLSERIDTGSAGGRMVFTLMAAFAQFERDLTAERTSAALQHKKSSGERVGTIPFGFQLAADGVTLLPVAEQQEAIRLIRELRSAGQTLQQIADRLAAAGIKTAKGKTTWTPKVVRSLASRAG